VKPLLPLALISDVHANLEALQAVLADIRAQGVRRVACLGDMVGYGPDPGPVLEELERSCDIIVAGNHEWAVLHGAVGFNWLAAQIIDEHRERLQDRHRKFIESLRIRHDENGWVFVHGSIRDPLMEYVFPDRFHFFDPLQLEELFEAVPVLCFCGHTHIPTVIREDLFCYYGGEVPIERGRKYIINPGSVGQPRDGDPRSSYAIFTGDRVLFRRLPYNLDLTCQKLVNERMAQRLRVGK
jgi:diadenosine tetraphosphatase ApaH/serine/threonine PP2A family protein phosphatase